MQYPYIVAFEGLDCSFKETNSKALEEYLNSRNIKAIRFSTPQYNHESSILVEKYLAGEYKPIMNSDLTDTNFVYSNPIVESYNENTFPDYYNISILYMVDMMDLWNKVLKKLEEASEPPKVIIFDRWFYSNIYYQGKYDEFPDSIQSVNDITTMQKKYELQTSVYIRRLANVFKLPEANLIIGMQRSLDFILEGLKEKHTKKKSDLYESNIDFLKRVHKRFELFIKYDETNRKFYGLNTVSTVGIQTNTFDAFGNEISYSKDVIFNRVKHVFNYHYDDFRRRFNKCQ